MAESDKSTENFALGIIVAVLLFLLFRAEWSRISRALGFGAGAGAGANGGAGAGAGTSGGAGASGGGCGCGCGGGSGKIIPFSSPISIGGQSYSGSGGYGNSVAG
jgi:hypothetical protein